MSVRYKSWSATKATKKSLLYCGHLKNNSDKAESTYVKDLRSQNLIKCFHEIRRMRLLERVAFRPSARLKVTESSDRSKYSVKEKCVWVQFCAHVIILNPKMTIRKSRELQLQLFLQLKICLNKTLMFTGLFCHSRHQASNQI